MITCGADATITSIVPRQARFRDRTSPAWRGSALADDRLSIVRTTYDSAPASLDPSGPLHELRLAAGRALRAKVAGPEARARTQEIWGTPGSRWFTPTDPIWRVHNDAAMFAGGITALLVQMLHPAAMAGVGDFSGYKSDPWGRLQRTADYIAVTTFGTIEAAEQVSARVARIHDRVSGTDELGRPYRGNDPDLLLWVHDAEIDAFLRAYQAYSPTPLTPAEADTYVEQTAIPARLLGIADPPLTVAQLRSQLRGFRADLAITNSAREASRFVVLHPPVGLAARPAYGMLVAGGVALVPGFARRMLGLPLGPRAARWVARPFGHGAVAGVRWALGGLDKANRLAPAARGQGL
ncbi:DUF2236 domain-containing protein [Pseudactinotalea sp. HY160]|nr:DUF2236 domain-containing protein [Pseudactinotalea sp. HY160]